MRFVLIAAVLGVVLMFGCALKPGYGVLNPNPPNPEPKSENTMSLKDCIRQLQTATPSGPACQGCTGPYPPELCRSNSEGYAPLYPYELNGDCLQGTEVGQRTDILYCNLDLKTCIPIVETVNNTISRKYNIRYQAIYTVPIAGNGANSMSQRNYSACKITIMDVN